MQAIELRNRIRASFQRGKLNEAQYDELIEQRMAVLRKAEPQGAYFRFQSLFDRRLKFVPIEVCFVHDWIGSNPQLDDRLTWMQNWNYATFILYSSDGEMKKIFFQCGQVPETSFGQQIESHPGEIAEVALFPKEYGHLAASFSLYLDQSTRFRGPRANLIDFNWYEDNAEFFADHY